MTVADAAALDLTDGMTLAAWVYPTTLGGWRTVVFKEDTAGFAYALDADADGASPAGYLTTDVAGFEALDDAPLSANTWTHIAVTYDGANLVLYVNGAVAGVTPASGTIVTTSGALRMGGNSPWGEYFAGRIDSVRIYDRALSPNEVALSQSVAIGDEASVGGGSGGGSPTPSVRSISYSYDGLLRLTEAAESPGAVYTYTYDLAGNRTSAWVDSLLVQSASYNDANQVVGWTYDATGNLISTGVATYTYDALNRQIARDTIAYDYNGDGVLVALDDGSLTRYVQDLATPLPVILDDGAAQYVYGHERLFGDDGSDRTWYLGDALGSVRLTLDAAGVPLAGLNYDPWGTPQSTTIAPFGFTGEPQQGSSVYLRARWYSTGRGSFGQRDTWQGNPQRPDTLHGYSYTANDPVNHTDPTGHDLYFWGFMDWDEMAKHRQLIIQSAQRHARGRASWEVVAALMGAHIAIEKRPLRDLIDFGQQAAVSSGVFHRPNRSEGIANLRPSLVAEIYFGLNPGYGGDTGVGLDAPISPGSMTFALDPVHRTLLACLSDRLLDERDAKYINGLLQDAAFTIDFLGANTVRAIESIERVGREPSIFSVGNYLWNGVHEPHRIWQGIKERQEITDERLGYAHGLNTVDIIDEAGRRLGVSVSGMRKYISSSNPLVDEEVLVKCRPRPAYGLGYRIDSSCEWDGWMSEQELYARYQPYLDAATSQHRERVR